MGGGTLAEERKRRNINNFVAWLARRLRGLSLITGVFVKKEFKFIFLEERGCKTGGLR